MRHPGGEGGGKRRQHKNNQGLKDASIALSVKMSKHSESITYTYIINKGRGAAVLVGTRQKKLKTSKSFKR